MSESNSLRRTEDTRRNTERHSHTGTPIVKENERKVRDAPRGRGGQRFRGREGARESYPPTSFTTRLESFTRRIKEAASFAQTAFRATCRCSCAREWLKCGAESQKRGARTVDDQSKTEISVTDTPKLVRGSNREPTVEREEVAKESTKQLSPGRRRGRRRDSTLGPQQRFLKPPQGGHEAA
eukprot:2347841-Rhodomonas_salina.1